MTTRTIHSAEYLYPGALFPEETYRDLPEATLEAAVAAAPDDSEGYFRRDGWYAVRIRTTYQKRYVADDGEEKWLAEGGPVKPVLSVIIGEKVHWEDPSIAGDEHDMLRSNIRGNSKDRDDPYGVKTRCGNWQMADDYDRVVAPWELAAIEDRVEPREVVSGDGS